MRLLMYEKILILPPQDAVVSLWALQRLRVSLSARAAELLLCAGLSARALSAAPALPRALPAAEAACLADLPTESSPSHAAQHIPAARAHTPHHDHTAAAARGPRPPRAAAVEAPFNTDDATPGRLHQRAGGSGTGAPTRAGPQPSPGDLSGTALVMGHGRLLPRERWLAAYLRAVERQLHAFEPRCGLCGCGMEGGAEGTGAKLGRGWAEGEGGSGVALQPGRSRGGARAALGTLVMGHRGACSEECAYAGRAAVLAWVSCREAVTVLCSLVSLEGCGMLQLEPRWLEALLQRVAELAAPYEPGQQHAPHAQPARALPAPSATWLRQPPPPPRPPRPGTDSEAADGGQAGQAGEARGAGGGPASRLDGSQLAMVLEAVAASRHRPPRAWLRSLTCAAAQRAQVSRGAG
jgi:hypothetical protein